MGDTGEIGRSGAIWSSGRESSTYACDGLPCDIVEYTLEILYDRAAVAVFMDLSLFAEPNGSVYLLNETGGPGRGASGADGRLAYFKASAGFQEELSRRRYELVDPVRE